MNDVARSTSTKERSKIHEPAHEPIGSAVGMAGASALYANPLGTIRHTPGTVLTLQRTIGNSAVRELMHQQQLLAQSDQRGFRPPSAFLAGGVAHSTAPVQRNELQDLAHDTREAVRADTLARIQGQAMFALLPALESVPADIRSDEALGARVGGPRLVTAMRVVKAKGTDWLAFAAANNGDLATLPNDQIGDIMHYLGAPKDARYFKSDLFDGRFDGAVDPAKGEVVLFFRVKFVVHNAKFGMSPPGTKEWFKEAEEGRQQFAAEFKQVVEKAWSGSTIRPACPIGSVKQLTVRVVVTPVDSGEHKLVYIHADTGSGEERSNMGDDVGNLKQTANEPKTHKTRYCDPKIDPRCTNPNLAKEVETTQIPSAHEFGHAIGLHHPHCDDNKDVCYGTNEDEVQSVMGKGDKQKTIKVKAGKQPRIHDDFMPFERIAQEWGKEVFPGALAKCNKWSGK